MNVYFSGSFWGHGKNERALTRIQVKKDFIWEDMDGFIPAVYMCGNGIVIDLCIRIPVEKIEAFLEKWNQERRLSGLNDEEHEQMERENPCEPKFSMEVVADGEKMIFDHGCGVGWHPLEFEKENIEDAAKELMGEYECDPNSGWYFDRMVYRFETERVKKPAKLRFVFRADEMPCCGNHFVTEENCDKRMIEITHPLTGKRYQLTIYGCKSEKIEIPCQRDMEWPKWCKVLSYSITPELPPDKFRIFDCLKSDQPVNTTKGGPKAADEVSVIGGSDGPIAVFMAGKRVEKLRMHAAYSALHFERTPDVEWRTVFYEKEKDDLTIVIEL